MTRAAGTSCHKGGTGDQRQLVLPVKKDNHLVRRRRIYYILASRTTEAAANGKKEPRNDHAQDLNAQYEFPTAASSRTGYIQACSRDDDADRTPAYTVTMMRRYQERDAAPRGMTGPSLGLPAAANQATLGRAPAEPRPTPDLSRNRPAWFRSVLGYGVFESKDA